MPLTRVGVRPRPAPIEKISPSALNRILECPRRVAYTRDDTTKELQRPTTRTALGLAAHGLTEAVSRGMGPPSGVDPTPWLEEEWDALIAAQLELLQLRWPGRDVPPARSWPGFAVTKVLLIRSLARRLSDGAMPSWPAVSRGHGHGGPPGLPWIERLLEDSTSKLFGAPDRVEEVDGRLRVVDLKSGVHQGEVTEAQRRQLLAYAWLVKCATGRLPDELAILDVRGRETVIAVDAAEVAALVVEVASAVEMFNQECATPSGVPARPAAGVCRWCEFRVVCADYWSAREDDWPSHADLAGVVVEVGSNQVEVAVDGENTWRLLLAGSEKPSTDDMVLAVDLEPAGYGTSRMRWHSRLRILPA